MTNDSCWVCVVKAKAELMDTKRRSTQFMLETTNLQDSLVSEQNKRSIAEAKVSTLTHELQDAGARLSAASSQVRKVAGALFYRQSRSCTSYGFFKHVCKSSVECYPISTDDSVPKYLL